MTESRLLNSYVDIQVNGYAGIDFNDPQTTVEDVERSAQALQADGVQTALPTVITASAECMVRCLKTLAQAIQSEPTASRLFPGVHVEGPFLSPQPGYIGAHPVECASPADPRLLESLIEAADNRVRLLTLAPEIDLEAELTTLCVERGILVAAGHTDATLEDLDRCIASGLQVFTHFGNGCPRLLDRHDNVLQRALNRMDHLKFTLIADSFHVPQVLFENLLRWLPLDRIAIVSDAISAAGLGPGTYQLGQRKITIGPDKAARDPSGEHFVGSACTLQDADRWLAEHLGLDAQQRARMMVENPKRWIGC